MASQDVARRRGRAQAVPDRQRWVRPGLASLTTLGVALVVATTGLQLTATPTTQQALGGSAHLVGVTPMFILLGVGVVLAWRRPDNPVGWLLALSEVELGLLLAGNVYDTRYIAAHDLPAGLDFPIVIATTIGWSSSFPTLLVLLPLVFPNGQLLSRRWRIVIWLTVATIAMTVATTILAGVAAGQTSLDAPPPAHPSTLAVVLADLDGPISGLFMLILIGAAVASLVIRYRDGSSELRHQLKWYVAAMVVAAVCVGPAFAGVTAAWANVLLILGLTAVPVSIAFAVLKYRLYDIDVVISRTVVYGSLAAFITAVYVGIVVGVGSLIGQGGHSNLPLSIVATAAVAVGFQPVRERLQKLANRLVYGRRATPYDVLAEFSGRVAETYAAREVLPRMVRVLADATGAATAAVWLRVGEQLRPAVSWPEDQDGVAPIAVTGQIMPAIEGASRAMPVRHDGELLGALAVSKRAGESLSPVEEKLLQDLANQAGLVLRNVRLTQDLEARLDDLQASRQRLVRAEDEERRRLERDLHEGAEKQLIDLKARLPVARDLARSSPNDAVVLLRNLKAEADEALEGLRDLARGIYPPLLADKGLVEALQAQARKARIAVEVLTEGISRYPQDIEATVYFCVLEALQNAQDHGQASGVRIRLTDQDGSLAFSIVDDGQGFDAATTARGVGLSNMGDRLDALGGQLTVMSTPGKGTQVSASLPTAAVAA